MKPALKKVTPSPQASLSFRNDKGKDLLNSWHYHPELELVFIKRSSGTRIVGDSTEYFHHSDLVLLGPDLPHTFNHDSSYINRKGAQRAEAIVIHFQKDFLGAHFWQMPEMKGIDEMISLSRQGLKISGKTRKHISLLMETMQHASPAARVILLLQILELLSVSKDYTLLASKGYNYSVHYADNDKISRIYQYTFENYSKKIKIEDVASLSLLSSPSFCRYFKMKTKKTYFQFLIEVRIGNACRLLLDSDLSISEISYSCGYTNISNFNHHFKKIAKMTPFQYRQDHIVHLQQIESLKLQRR